MASFQKVDKGWRVQICIDGIRESATFSSKFDAKAWATERSVILRRAKKPDIDHWIADSRRLFVEFSDLLSESDILSKAKKPEDVSGVYFLIRDEKIVYVGQSKCVYARLETHKKEKDFDKVTIVKCAQDKLKPLEELYIRKFQPPLNIASLNKLTDVEIKELLMA